MKLTHDNIHALGTGGKGFNRNQLALLGISWPPKKGWLTALIGTEITKELYDEVRRASTYAQNDYKPTQCASTVPPTNQPDVKNLLKALKQELSFGYDMTPRLEELIEQIDQYL